MVFCLTGREKKLSQQWAGNLCGLKKQDVILRPNSSYYFKMELNGVSETGKENIQLNLKGIKLKQVTEIYAVLARFLILAYCMVCEDYQSSESNGHIQQPAKAKMPPVAGTEFGHACHRGISLLHLHKECLFATRSQVGWHTFGFMPPCVWKSGIVPM